MRGSRLALLAAAAAAVIGFSAGIATRDDAGTSGVAGLAIGGALLNYPEGWQLVGGPRRILGTAVTTTAALEPRGAAGAAGARLVAGVIPGRAPADLPELLAPYGASARSQVVLLQGRRAYHLTGLREGDRTLDLFVLPITLSAPATPGLITVGCVVPRAARGSFLPACRSLAAQTAIVGVGWDTDLRPDPAYAGRIDAALARLDRERAAARSALGARRAAAYQAQDAERSAAAGSAAARAVAAAGPPDPARRVNAAVVSELRAASAAYAALALAARDRDTAAFHAASRDIAGAENGVARALRGLTVLGYAAAR